MAISAARDLLSILTPASSSILSVTMLAACAALRVLVVMGAIEKPTADADEWNTVIDRLVTAALPATDPVPIDPEPDHEDLS